MLATPEGNNSLGVHQCQHTEAEDDLLPSEAGPRGCIQSQLQLQKHLQDDQCLAKAAEVKGNGVSKRLQT